MLVGCTVCRVHSDIPDGATACQCPNCGTKLMVRSDGTTRKPFEPMKIILPGLVVCCFSSPAMR
jgi:predicted RNA-binding Zn-ribbon protein involved in translation (DUF1610 family)